MCAKTCAACDYWKGPALPLEDAPADPDWDASVGDCTRFQRRTRDDDGAGCPGFQPK